MSDSTIELPIVVILIIVVFILALVFGTNIGKGIFEWLGKYLPGGSGSGAGDGTPDYAVAEYSYKALSCGMGYVASGGETDCGGYAMKSQLVAASNPP